MSALDFMKNILLMLRPDEVSITLRPEPVEANTLRQAQGERSSYIIGPYL
jgi:hypothetical protein